MSILNLPASYFALPDPLYRMERILNRYCHSGEARINGRRVQVFWTSRAARRLQTRQRPLVVELQLYFSCVVKKRVLFHEQTQLDTTPVAVSLELAFRAVASAVSEPCEFAQSYPRGRSLSQGRAARMIPRRVEIDFRRGRWEGAFSYSGRD